MGRRLPRIVLRSSSAKRFNPMLMVTSMLSSFPGAFFFVRNSHPYCLSDDLAFENLSKDSFSFMALGRSSKRGKLTWVYTLRLLVPLWWTISWLVIITVTTESCPFSNFLGTSTTKSKQEILCWPTPWQIKVNRQKQQNLLGMKIQCQI